MEVGLSSSVLINMAYLEIILIKLTHGRIYHFKKRGWQQQLDDN